MPAVNTVFVDTNILLYRRDPREPEKQAIAESWLETLARERAGRVSWQVLQEFYFNGLRKLVACGLEVSLAREDVRALIHWQPLSPDGPLFESAWTVQDRHGLSWWDALIVAAALRQGCTQLLTEDLQHGLQVEGVRGGGTLTVLNPFAPGAPQPY